MSEYVPNDTARAIIISDVSRLLAAWEHSDRLPSEVAPLLTDFVLSNEMALKALAELQHIRGQDLTADAVIKQLLAHDD
jgi:hypothetical protein